MKTRISCRLLAVTTSCLLLIANLGNAQTHTWTNTLGGNISDPGNWDIGVPGPNAMARFNSTATYGVVINGNFATNNLFILGGEVSFLGGNVFKLTQDASFRGGRTRITGLGTELQVNRNASLEGTTAPSLLIDSGGELFVDDMFFIGTAVSNWTGTATVRDSGSLLTVVSELKIGDTGNGTLTIENGGVVDTPLTVVGTGATGVGQITITDEGSQLESNDMYLGWDPSDGSLGDATLNLQSGGDAIVGNDGPASDTGANLYVSDTGAPAILRVDNGSLLNIEDGAFLGRGSNGGGVLTMNDSNWISGNTIRVGFLGNGTLNVDNGSVIQVLNNRAVLVATNAPSTGVLNVDGNGSGVTAREVWAGTRGAGTMNVTDGGDVNNAAGNGYIAGLGGTATATVNGLGSRWFNRNLFLGRTAGADGGAGTLNVENRGVVYVGNNTPSVTDALIVSDTGSGGMLMADNGSKINCRDAFIGYAGNASGLVELTGVGTQWNISGDLSVGLLGTGTLTINESALLDAGRIHVNNLSEVLLNDGMLATDSRIQNEGLLRFAGFNNEVFGEIKNLAGGDMTVESGTNASCLGRVEHNGNTAVIDGDLSILAEFVGGSAFTGVGSVSFGGNLQPFDETTGQLLFAGGLDVILESSANTEIDIASAGNFDRMLVSGDLSIEGNISVDFINGFQPSAGQEYLIASVMGTSSGQFNSMGQDEMVAQFGTVGIFVDYQAGDGNDLALYTALVPDVVVPAEVNVTKGTLVSGGLFEIQNSDNLDLSIRRSTSDIQSRTEFTVASFATSANPTFMSVTLEGAVFARTTVLQQIRIYNYDTQQYELVDARNAARFTDSTTTIEITGGNLGQYVEDGTNAIAARVLYTSLNPRQQFSSNTDRFSWSFGQ